MISRRPGFTLVEVLAAMTVASLLAAIAIPRYEAWITRAHAAEVAAEMRLIRLAAYNFREQKGAWPDEAAAGVVPDGLNETLPSGFDFGSPRYTWDWEHFELPEGPLVGLAVTPAEPELGWALSSMFGSTVVQLEDRYMFFIDSPVPLPVGSEVGDDDGTAGSGDDGHPGRGRGRTGEHPGRGPGGEGPPGHDNRGPGNNSGQGNEDPGSRGEDRKNDRGNGGRSGR